MRQRCAAVARHLQDTIRSGLEELDGGRFREDEWTRPGGGGGRTLALAGGGIFEKAGINFSEVHGELSQEFASRLPGDGRTFFATGVSLILHPFSPRVPAVHANFRYLEKGSRWWFGGGSDLTPYRLYAEDARHFHRVWKEVCDRHDPAYSPRFKKWCDEYFYLPHRGETRGVGGIFFDELAGDAEKVFQFWREAGESFLRAYVPIVTRRRAETFDWSERSHQLRRRGRYAEFNLLYDRGTQFGLKTAGRVESILISLPPVAQWEYNPPAPVDGPEVELNEVLRSPRDWLAEEAAPRPE
jgi:coproporphyrinogen III oxidase